MDSIVTTIIAKFEQRAKFGKAKYGTDLDRTDLSVLDWIHHAQEEHMDAILYLEKLKKEISKPCSHHETQTPGSACPSDTHTRDPSRKDSGSSQH